MDRAGLGLPFRSRPFSFRCFVQRFSNDFTFAAATMPKRPQNNIRDRTETLGAACCVCWLQTGHHIVGGRMPREKRISLSIASSRSRRAITCSHSIPRSTLAAGSRSSRKTTCGWHRPQASTRLLGISQPPDLSVLDSRSNGYNRSAGLLTPCPPRFNTWAYTIVVVTS